MPFPFVNYADFEAMAEKIIKCAPEQNESYSETYQKHANCAYGYEIICSYDDRLSKPVQIYRNYCPWIHRKYDWRSWKLLGNS